MDNKKLLMNRIQVCDFILAEVGLYLDTHPDDKDALAYHAKYQEMRKKAVEEYTRQFGPLTSESHTGITRWSWVDTPWPWEFERAV